jgi:hypothetical protein
MPAQDVLRRFIAKVESNDHVGAIEAFYADDASMQENGTPPRRGKALLMDNERKVLARMQSVTSRCVDPVFVNGEHVVIRWIFEFVALDGARTRIEELAYQRWNGDRIVQEQFFYDPVQLKPLDPV